MDRNGTVLETNGFAISLATNNQTAPAIAFNGSDYLVWEDYRNNPNTSDVYGARVTSLGLLSDLNGIPISRAANYQITPAVASDGTNHLVVWEDWRNSGTTAKDIYGARVNLAGVVTDANGIPICTAPRDQAAPAVAFDGVDYFVAWQDRRNAVNGLDIYGARVDPLGAVLDPSGIAINTNSFNQQLPALASSWDRKFLVASQGTQDGINRIVGNLVSAQVAPIAQSQLVTVSEDTPVGDALTFSIVTPPAHGTLRGAPPNLIYQPATNFFGPDHFTFKANDGLFDSAPATVSITVLPVNDPPEPAIVVSPLTPLPGVSNLVVLAPVCRDATVILDGSQSRDADHDPLQFTWTEGTNLLGATAMVTNRFAPGSHTITLRVSDGTDAVSATATFTVLMPEEAVWPLARLLIEADLGHRHTAPLLATLRGAANAFEHCRAAVGILLLKAFQHQVHAQIAPYDSALARTLTEAAQEIIHLVAGGLNRRGAAFHPMPRWSHGRLGLKFSAPPGRHYFVQASSDLQHWETLGVAEAQEDGTFAFQDSNAGEHPRRFYRILSP